MSRYLAEPRSILAEPLGSAEPRLKNTALDIADRETDIKKKRKTDRHSRQRD